MALKPTIETFNALPLAEYRRKLWGRDSEMRHPRQGVSTIYDIFLETSYTMPPELFTACFNLISSTSSTDYANSSIGWAPARKRREMRLPDLRYIILKQRKAGEGEAGAKALGGFLSFMLTYEDGYEVIYCYEVQLSSQLQGMGLGKRLMEMMEEVGRKAGVEKGMLTVFKANKAATKFYENLGYQEDENSPRPRKLRGGVLKEPDYMILSKPLTKEGKFEYLVPRYFKRRKAN